MTTISAALIGRLTAHIEARGAASRGYIGAIVSVLEPEPMGQMPAG